MLRLAGAIALSVTLGFVLGRWTVGTSAAAAGRIAAGPAVQVPAAAALAAALPAGVAGGGAEDDVPACGNVNSDDKVDLTDAVYLLNWLFLGGPEPVCPPSGDLTQCLADLDECRASQGGRGLPATGQKQCYDEDGSPVSCESSAYPGQDGHYQTGCPTLDRFDDNGDGTITDTCTGLMWQQNTADTSGDGKVSAADAITWSQALAYCEALILCQDGTWTTSPATAAVHGGVKHDDWRLPNVVELSSLLDRGRPEPFLDPVFLGGSTSCNWTSTTVTVLPRSAWYVFFKLGCLGVEKTGVLYLRAVRSAD